MLTHYFKVLQAVFSEPIYVFHEGTAGTYCDKLTEPRHNNYKRSRYIITGGQCACLSWMKSSPPRTCKHLKMLAGDFSFADEVGEDYIIKALQSLEEHGGDRLGGLATYLLNHGTLPASSSAIEIGIGKADFHRIVAPVDFPEAKRLWVSFVRSESEETS